MLTVPGKPRKGWEAGAGGRQGTDLKKRGQCRDELGQGMTIRVSKLAKMRYLFYTIELYITYLGWPELH